MVAKRYGAVGHAAKIFLYDSRTVFIPFRSTEITLLQRILRDYVKTDHEAEPILNNLLTGQLAILEGMV